MSAVYARSLPKAISTTVMTELCADPEQPAVDDP